MKRYVISIPITGRLLVEVEAENDDEAMTKAFEEAELKEDNLEWETHEIIVEGNVFCGMQNTPDIEVCEEIE